MPHDDANELADSIDDQTGAPLFPPVAALVVANKALAAGLGGASTPVDEIEAAAEAAAADLGVDPTA